MAEPPTDLLGCPIECTSVQIVDVSAFRPPPSMPQVLLIRNIPALIIPNPDFSHVHVCN